MDMRWSLWIHLTEDQYRWTKPMLSAWWWEMGLVVPTKTIDVRSVPGCRKSYKSRFGVVIMRVSLGLAANDKRREGSLSPRTSSHIPSYVQQELRPLLLIPRRGLSLSITWHLCRWCNLYLIWSSESPSVILSSVETWDVPMERKPTSQTPVRLPLTFPVVTGPCNYLFDRGLSFQLKKLPTKSLQLRRRRRYL